jgi:hypothetical protein
MVVSRSTCSRTGTVRSVTRASSCALARSSASICSRCSWSKKRWCAVTAPWSPASSRGRGARSRPVVCARSRSGSVSPAISARHPGGLHRDEGAAARGQPVREREQPGRRGRERRDVARDPRPLLHAGTRDHRLLVDVQRRTARMESLHCRSSSFCPAAAWSRSIEVYEACSRVHQTRGDSPRGSRGSRSNFTAGSLSAPIGTTDLGATAGAATAYQPFHPSGSRPPAGMINFTERTAKGRIALNPY